VRRSTRSILQPIIDAGDPVALTAQLDRGGDFVSEALQLLAWRAERLDLLECVLRSRPTQWDLDVGLDFAAHRRGSAPFVRALLAAGAAVEGNHGALWNAAAAGDDENLRLLLAAGGDPNVPHGHGEDRLPLVAAIRSGVAAAVEVLLDGGADPNEIGPDLRRPIDVAEECGDATIVRLLIGRGARTVSPDDLDLEQAAYGGFLDRVRALLAGASPEQRGLALHCAVRTHTAIVEAILTHGDVAPWRLQDAFGTCVVNDTLDVVPLLLAAGVDPDAPIRHFGEPPVVFAAGAGRVDMLRLLLGAGADLAARSEDGENALAAARRNGRTAAVRFLESVGATARTPAQIKATAKEKLAGVVRSSWKPRLSVGVGRSGDPSRFGGLPALRPAETWPGCADCGGLLTFFVQVDLARTPKAVRELFGPGLLQLFYCTACRPHRPFSGGQRVRIVDPTDTLDVQQAPAGVQVFDKQPIFSWGAALNDFPLEEGHVPLEAEEHAIVHKLNRQGDKLSGWPNWVQDPEYPLCPQGAHRLSQLILQIDSGRGVAHTWGDNGVGFILQCPHHRDQVTFLWQSA